jgi:hypothetical protein
MKQHRKRWHVQWRIAGLVAASGAATAGLLLAGLTSIVPRLTATEAHMLLTSAHPSNLLADPLHLPLKLLQWSALASPIGGTVLLGRLPSVLLGLGSAFAFLHITRRWYGRRSMVLGTLLFITSAWFLHVSRFAGLDIEYLAGMLTLLVIHIGLYDHDDRPLMLFGWLLANLALLFIPGFVWFILLSLLWQWRVLIKTWQRLRPLWVRLLWSVLAAAGTAGLAARLVRSPALVMPWLGLPMHFINWWVTMRHVGGNFSALVYHGPHNPELWLGRLPLLDAFLSAMFVMGLVFYALHWRAARTRLIAGYLLLGAALAGLQGEVRLSVIMPLVYIVIVGGVAYTLYLWLRRFPRNPIGRLIGLAGIVLLVAVSCTYNLEQYFIAWPHNPETQQLLTPR